MRAIQDGAIDLFEARGFENVPVDLVAETAQVSPSTVYRYFGTKENLVVWDELDERVEAALVKQLGKTKPLADFRQAFVSAFSDLSKTELKTLRRRADLIDREPQLLAAQVAALHGAQEELLPVLTKVYKRSKRDLVLEMSVRLAFTALVAGLEHWQGSKSKQGLGPWIERAFDALGQAAGEE